MRIRKLVNLGLGVTVALASVGCSGKPDCGILEPKKETTKVTIIPPYSAYVYDGSLGLGILYTDIGLITISPDQIDPSFFGRKFTDPYTIAAWSEIIAEGDSVSNATAAASSLEGENSHEISEPGVYANTATGVLLEGSDPQNTKLSVIPEGCLEEATE